MITNDKIFLEISREALARGDHVRFQASGSSMYPFIRNADTLEVSPFAVARLRYGDVVLCNRPDGRLVAHRIIKKRFSCGKIEVLTKGDTASHADGYIKSEDVIGRVRSIRRGQFIMKIDNGLPGAVNMLYSASLPLSKWIYLGFEKACSNREVCRYESREDELIRLAALASGDERTKERLKELIGPALDWQYIIKKSGREGVLPLVYQATDGCRGHLPKNFLEILENTYYANISRNIKIQESARRVVAALEENGIKTILLKGAYLAECVYKSIALRPMTDIDILIKRSDLCAANEILVRLGYEKPARYEDIVGDGSVSPLNSLMYIMSAADRTQPSLVHLHWHIINSTWPVEDLVRRIDMERVWSTAYPVTVGGTATRTLSQEFLIIHLCHHALNHAFDKLILMSDIIALIRNSGNTIDWGMVSRDAENCGLSEIIYESLLYVSLMSGMDIPQLKMFDSGRRGILWRIADLMTRKKYRSYALSYLIYCAAKKGFARRVRFVWKTFFPSRCVLALRKREPH